MEDFDNELARLPQRSRVAFAAVCAQRALVIYEYTTHDEIIRRGPSVAIETAWTFAEGADLDKKQIEFARTEVEKAYPEEEDGGGPELFSVSAAQYALEAIEDPTPESALLAAGRVLDCIGPIDEEDGVEEEHAWQRRALQLIESLGDKPIRRDLFKDLIDKKPEWQKRFEK
jgi:hypothetical protein